METVYHVTTKNETVNKIIKKLVDFDPLQIILFGSHALDLTHKYSDVDLLVVVKNGTDTKKIRTDMSSVIDTLLVTENTVIDKDVFVVTPNDIIERENIGVDIIYFALRNGIVLYNKNYSKKIEVLRLLQHGRTDIETLNKKTLPASHLMAMLAWNVIVTSLKTKLVIDDINLCDINTIYKKFNEKLLTKHDMTKLTAMVYNKKHACGYIPKYNKSEIIEWRDIALEMFDNIYINFTRHYIMDSQTKHWLRDAANNLYIAKKLDIDAANRCNNAQQCAEKALKAAQINEHGQHAPIHLLDVLHDSLSFSINVSTLDLRWLTGWGVDGKYYPHTKFCTEQDAERACKLAETIYDEVKNRLV